MHEKASNSLQWKLNHDDVDHLMKYNQILINI